MREVALLLAEETRGQRTGRALFYLAAPMPLVLTFVVPAVGGEGADVGLALAVLFGLVGFCMVVAALVRRQGGRAIACIVPATLVAAAPLPLVVWGLSMGLRALFP